MSAYISPPQKC